MSHQPRKTSVAKEQSFAYPLNTTVFRVGSISEVLNVDETLGSGTYATVKKCQEKTGGRGEKAVKLIAEDTFMNSKKQLQTEVAILSKFPKHKRILALDEIVRVPGKYFCIVTELVKGGDLFDFIVNYPGGQLPEYLVREVMIQLVEGVTVLHNHDILHRDLKPENVLMVNTVRDKVDIKIADFGLATFVTEKPIVKNCGTTGYTAPEVLSKKPYGKACDMWSLGVIMYAMLHGYLPFHGADDAEMKKKILSLDYRFSRRTVISVYAKSLVKSLLSMDPRKRPSCDNIMNHPWFTLAEELESQAS